jgi:hypothetical protein
MTAREAEFIEIGTAPISVPQVVVAPMANGNATEGPRLHISLDESAPESDPPEPFEVCPNLFFISWSFADITQSRRSSLALFKVGVQGRERIHSDQMVSVIFLFVCEFDLFMFIVLIRSKTV